MAVDLNAEVKISLYFTLLLILIATNISYSQNLSLIGGHNLSKGSDYDQVYDEVVIGDQIFTTGKIKSSNGSIQFELAKWDKKGNLVQNALFALSNFYTKNTIVNKEGNMIVLLGFNNSDNCAIIEFNQNLELVRTLDQLDFMEDIIQLNNGRYITCGESNLYQIKENLSGIEKVVKIETGGYLDIERLLVSGNKLITFSEFAWTNNVTTPWPLKPSNVWASDILTFEINQDLNTSSIQNIHRYGGSGVEKINSRRDKDPTRDHIIPLNNGGYLFSCYTNSFNGDITDSDTGPWSGNTWLVRLNPNNTIQWSNKLSGRCEGLSDLEVLDNTTLLAVAEKKLQTIFSIRKLIVIVAYQQHGQVKSI